MTAFRWGWAPLAVAAVLVFVKASKRAVPAEGGAVHRAEPSAVRLDPAEGARA